LFYNILAASEGFNEPKTFSKMIFWYFGNPLPQVVFQSNLTFWQTEEWKFNAKTPCAIFSIKLQLISDLVKGTSKSPSNVVFFFRFLLLFVPLVSLRICATFALVDGGTNAVDSDKCPRIYNNLRLIYCPTHSLRWVRFGLIGEELCAYMLIMPDVFRWTYRWTQ